MAHIHRSSWERQRRHASRWSTLMQTHVLQGFYLRTILQTERDVWDYRYRWACTFRTQLHLWQRNRPQHLSHPCFLCFWPAQLRRTLLVGVICTRTTTYTTTSLWPEVHIFHGREWKFVDDIGVHINDGVHIAVAEVRVVFWCIKVVCGEQVI